VLTGVSRDILKIGAAAQASSARAQSAALKQQAANVRASATARIEALKSAEAAMKETAARMRAAGATRSQIAAVDAQARAYAKDAAIIQAETSKQIDVLHKQAKVYDEQAKSLEKDVQGHQRLSRTLSDVSSAASMAGLAMIGLGAVGAAALMSTVKGAIEYDRQVALTMTQTDGFKTSLKELGQIGKDVGSKIAVPFQELQGALYDIFSSTNANVKEATALLKSFAKAAVAGQVSIDDAARSTMGIMNAFKIPFQQVNTVLDKQFQLVRKGVGTYGEFSKVIGKLTPSAVRFGQNLDTMDATLIFLTRNGLNTASAVAAAARAFDALANPKTVGKLESSGIKVRDLQGKFLPLIDILKNMRKYLLALPPPSRAKALFDIFKSSGGTIQAKRFFDLVLPTAKGAGNLDQFEGFLKDMKNSAGQFGQAYSTMAGTVAAKSQLLKNNWDVMKVTIGQALEPAFSKLLDTGNKLIGWFNQLTPAQQASLAKWALMAAAIMTAVGVVLLIVGGIGALAAAFAALGLSLGAVLLIVVGVAAVFALLGAAVYGAYKGSQPIRKLFADIGKTFSDIWTKDLQPFITGVRDSFNKDLLPAFQKVADVINKDVIPRLDELWNKFGKELVKVLGEALRILKDLAESGFKFVSWVIEKMLLPVIKMATKYYDDHKKGIDQVIKIVAQLIKWIVIIIGGAALGGLIIAVALVIAIFAGLVIAVTGVVSIIGTLIHWISNLVVWLGSVISSAGKLGDSINKGIRSGLDKAINFLSNLGNTINNAVGNLGSVLWNAGADIISGLMNGIGAQLGRLRGYLGNIGSWIASWKGPPEKDIKILHNAGQLILKGLQNGLASEVPNLKAQLKGITTKMQASVNADVSGTATVPTKQKGSASKTVVVNVYTQEIRPEYHSQQLGQLMAGRI
jgi:TP901 family phage tail tape measure protein